MRMEEVNDEHSEVKDINMEGIIFSLMISPRYVNNRDAQFQSFNPKGTLTAHATNEKICIYWCLQ